MRDPDARSYLRERAAALLNIADGMAPSVVARLGLHKPRHVGTVFIWLNPIEKMWKWLVADVLSAHRHASQWEHLRQRVEYFLERFTKPSKELLKYCGLLAD